jgi:hypothetical protein
MNPSLAVRRNVDSSLQVLHCEDSKPTSPISQQNTTTPNSPRELGTQSQPYFNNLSTNPRPTPNTTETYEKEKPHCEHCGQIFSRPYDMKRHIQRKHTKEKPFHCEICEQLFATLNEMKIHEWSHKEEKPFRCKYCKKGYANSSRLNRHIRYIHTKEKPFHCEQCRGLFTSRWDLKVHKRFHTGEKPFRCQYCTRRFRIKMTMKGHERYCEKGSETGGDIK